MARKIKGTPIKTKITRKWTGKRVLRSALKIKPKTPLKTTKTKTGVKVKKGPVQVAISLGDTKAAKAIKRRKEIQAEYDKALGYKKKRK